MSGRGPLPCLIPSPSGPPCCERLAIRRASTYLSIMNRRDFAKSLGCLGLAPVLPSMSLPAVAPAYTPYMYGLGVHLARSTGGSSASLLVQKLGLSSQAAKAMQAQMIRNGVVSTSGTAGVAAAVQPYMKGRIAAKAAAGPVAEFGKSVLRRPQSADAERPDHAMTSEDVPEEPSASGDPHP